MKYPPEIYAKVLAGESLKKDLSGEDIFKRFLEVIRKNGDMIGIKKILAALSREEARRSGGRVVKIESARVLGEKTVSRIREKFGVKDILSETVNPRLVAGVRITIDDEKEIDNSLSHKLRALF